jgi:3D (Asp-Asp-Asp) domain-containing protein
LAIGAAVLLPAPTAAPRTQTPTPTMRVSLYYAAIEDDYRRGADGAFRDRRGAVLYRASTDFVAAASIEGSAITDTRRALAFDPERPAAGWAWSQATYGVDALGCPLIPYRSAATPPSIPLGTRLFIRETVGLPLPDGRRHDGYWYATDRGVGITGDRIDLFMQSGMASMRAGERYGLEYLRPVHVRLVGRIDHCPQPGAIRP